MPDSGGSTCARTKSAHRSACWRASHHRAQRNVRLKVSRVGQVTLEALSQRWLGTRPAGLHRECSRSLVSHGHGQRRLMKACKQSSGRPERHPSIPVEPPARQESHRFPNLVVDHNGACVFQKPQWPRRQKTSFRQVIQESMEPLNLLKVGKARQGGANSDCDGSASCAIRLGLTRYRIEP
jgi:hypothetical protein